MAFVTPAPLDKRVASASSNFTFFALGYPQQCALKINAHNHLTMRSRTRSNTALFQIGQQWLQSVLINHPRRGGRGAMDFWCVAAPRVGAKCFATGAPAVGAASGCSRG
jgi:hypothetical protein